MFTRSNLKDIRTDIATALALVEKKHGIKLNLGNIRFTDTTFGMKLEAIAAGKDASNLDVARAKFKASAKRLGIKPESFGAMFEVRGVSYQLLELNTRAKHYPVIGRSKGRDYKFALWDLPANMKSWS